MMRRSAIIGTRTPLGCSSRTGLPSLGFSAFDRYTTRLCSTGGGESQQNNQSVSKEVPASLAYLAPFKGTNQQKELLDRARRWTWGDIGILIVTNCFLPGVAWLFFFPFYRYYMLKARINDRGGKVTEEYSLVDYLMIAALPNFCLNIVTLSFYTWLGYASKRDAKFAANKIQWTAEELTKMATEASPSEDAPKEK